MIKTFYGEVGDNELIHYHQFLKYVSKKPNIRPIKYWKYRFDLAKNNPDKKMGDMKKEKHGNLFLRSNQAFYDDIQVENNREDSAEFNLESLTGTKLGKGVILNTQYHLVFLKI